MDAATPLTSVALLAIPGCTSAATVYGFFDALSGTRRDWQMLHGGTEVASPSRPSWAAVMAARRRAPKA